MKTLFALLPSFLFALALPAQQAPPDYPALPDTAFDAWIYHTPVAQAQAAEQHFRRQLDSLRQQARPDTVAIARTWRRIAAARLSNNGHGWEAHPFIQTSVRLLYQTKPLPEAELAKSLLVYANDLMSVGGYDSCIWALQTAIEINRRLYGEGSEGVGLDYRALATAYGNTTRYEEGLVCAKKAVEILREVWQKPHPYFARTLFIRGWQQMELGYFELSLKDYVEAEAIMRQTLGIEHPVTAGIYHFMGMSLQSLGDYDKALDCYKRAYTVREKTLGANHGETRYALTSIGDLYLEIGEYEQAVYYREKASDILEEYKNNVLVGFDKAPPYIRLYATVGDFEKEARLFEYYLPITTHVLNSRPESDGGYVATAYGCHAFALAKQQRWVEALDWSEQAIALSQKMNPDAPQIANEYWQQKGEILTALGRFGEAETAFAELLQHPRNPGDEMKAWKGKADLFLEKYRRSGQPADLEIAENNYLTAIEKLDALRLSAWSPASRMEQSRLNFNLFEGALEASALQNDLDKAFWLAEKSKAQSLLENLRDDLARRTAGLPDSFSRLESSLKNEIAALEQKAFETSPGAELEATEASLFEKKQALGALAKSFETDHPEYFRLKYSTALASAADLQNRPEGSGQALLDERTALLEYFLGDSSIFIFTLTKNDLKLTRLPKPPDFDATLEKLRKSLTDNGFRQAEIDVDSFAEASAKLYDWLLAAPLASLDSAVKNLIIVPDGSLGYLPFDILGKPSRSQTGTSADFKTFDYLLRSYNVSYAYSANLLLEQSQRAAELPGDLEIFAGFAPIYESSDTLDLASRSRGELVRNGKYDLPGARQEVQEIASLLGGQSFLAEAASEHNFKQNSQQFRILHLAMHTVLEDRNPMFSKLLFTQNAGDGNEDNDLNAMELYAMRLPAQLAVLSACETGFGKVRRGEGILSLSRAFTCAGVPATLMSLWRADDEATRQVMVSFYKNLKAGMRKDEALRQAKLTFLESCGKENASPFFWAGFVAAGEMGAVFR